MELTIPIPWSLTANAKEQLQSSLPFVDAGIVSFSIQNNPAQVSVNLIAGSDARAIGRKLERLLELCRPLRHGDLVRVVYENDSTPPNSQDIFPQLMARKELYQHGPGLFSFSGTFLKLCRKLDERVQEFAATQSAREVVLPVTTSLKSLQEGDFFRRTPQFAQFICKLSADADKILDFANHVGEDQGCTKLLSFLDSPQYMCRSAICLSSYPQFSGRVLAPAEYETWTTFGKAFRNEAFNVISLERLHEFSMREIIYFGDREYVTQGLAACLVWFKSLMSTWNINGNIQTANDPFFAEKLQALQFYQLAEQSKLEVRWWNPSSGNDVSVGSINNHGHHFSKAYNIKLADGQFATTGCVGFGYERFVFIFLSQFGLESRDWPLDARAFWDM